MGIACCKGEMRFEGIGRKGQKLTRCNFKVMEEATEIFHRGVVEIIAWIFLGFRSGFGFEKWFKGLKQRGATQFVERKMKPLTTRGAVVGYFASRTALRPGIETTLRWAEFMRFSIGCWIWNVGGRRI